MHVAWIEAMQIVICRGDLWKYKGRQSSGVRWLSCGSKEKGDDNKLVFCVVRIFSYTYADGRTSISRKKKWWNSFL